MKSNLLKHIRQPVIALAAGFLSALLIILCTADNPLTAVQKFFAGPFSSPYYFGCMLNTAGLLLLSAMGSDIAIESGNMNLGGEGQIYAGGFLTAFLLNHFNTFSLWGPAALFLTALLICASCGMVTCISYGLYKIKGVNILLSTFLISQACIPVIDGAIAGPFRDTSGNLLATPFIAPSMRFPQLLKPSLFNASFFIVIVLYVFFIWFMSKTKSGHSIVITGTAPEFARYTGIPTNRIQAWCLVSSGALHGITGFFAVTGAYYTCHNGFYSGMGWNALTVALIAKKRPALIAPSALLLAYLFTASNKATLTNSLNFDLPGIIQGVILFCITATLLLPAIRKGGAE